MKDANYLGSVREQYEDYPYPPRDPENERKALIGTDFDFLGKVSHYCFNGRLDPDKNLRILVAGGGTGDATIFLAEQLRGTNAQLVYLDISARSMEIAKQRAMVRGLDNIEWMHGSLLDLPKLEIGEFDYINCCGVLHHLEDPVRGLNSLKARLKDGGAMGIMVYGRYGRTSVYHTQELMRLVNAGETDPRQQLKNARAVLDCLPKTNWLKSGPVPLGSAANLSDSDLFDLFLHSQDRSYTVLELYQWLGDSGLHLIEFAANKALYRPDTFIKNSELLGRIGQMPENAQQAVAENIAGVINKHAFYASARRDTIASLEDGDNIPYFCDGLPSETMHADLHAKANAQPHGAPIELTFPNSKATVSIPPGPYTRYFFKYADSKTSLNEIVHLIRDEAEFGSRRPSTEEVFSEFQRVYRILNMHDLMLLRSKGIHGFKTYRQLQAPVSLKYGTMTTGN